jgi:hypothetical protein
MGIYLINYINQRRITSIRELQLTIKHLSMKRIKTILNALAIIVAITGAIATRVYMQDNDQAQYIPVNNTYEPAGDIGVDYNCYDSNNTCTFYLPDSVARHKEYLPFRKGQYVPLKK